MAKHKRIWAGLSGHARTLAIKGESTRFALWRARKKFPEATIAQLASEVGVEYSVAAKHLADLGRPPRAEWDRTFDTCNYMSANGALFYSAEATDA